MARPQDLTWKHDVMSCPACRETITATIVVRPNLGSPVLRPDGSGVDLAVNAALVRFHIGHHCSGRAEAVATPHLKDQRGPAHYLAGYVERLNAIQAEHEAGDDVTLTDQDMNALAFALVHVGGDETAEHLRPFVQTIVDEHVERILAQPTPVAGREDAASSAGGA